MVLELLKFGRCRTLQFHVVQPFQDEGGFFAIGRKKGVERILGLVEVRWSSKPGDTVLKSKEVRKFFYL